MSKKSPISFLINHKDKILPAYNRNNCKPVKTWEELHETLPELSQVMSINTFKQYMSVLAALEHESDKVIQKKSRSMQETIELLEDRQNSNERDLKRSLAKLDKVIQDRNRLRHELLKTEDLNTELQTQIITLQNRLDKIVQPGDAAAPNGQPPCNPPKRIAGWSIQKSKDGYYRCYRKIRKKVHSVYIGKMFDSEKARIRVAEKEEQIRLYSG